MRRHIPLPIKLLRSHLGPYTRAPLRCARRYKSTSHDPIPSPSLESQPESRASPIATSSKTVFDPVVNDGFTKPFYITAPPFSTAGSPHLGHFHSAVLADTVARYSRLRYPDRSVSVAIGTSEYGPRIHRAAEKAQRDSWDYVESTRQRYKIQDLVDQSNVQRTDFISSEAERHVVAVRDFWERLVAAGVLYKTTREGWYDPHGEFYPEDQVRKSADGRVFSRNVQELAWEEETVWMFRLSRFREELLEWIERPLTVHPPSLRFKIMSLISSVEDVAVSRPSRSDRGISVPGDQGQVVNESMDGLVTYITSLGYPGYTDIWPADIHVTDTDMLTSHTTFWPAMLMSAGIALPRSILAHSDWTRDGTKLSRDNGNIVDPRGLIRFYGADAVRWHVLRSGPGAKEVEFSIEHLEEDYKFLSSRLGHLANRMLKKSLIDRATAFEPGDRDEELERVLHTTKDEFVRRIEALDVHRACDVVVDLVNEANRMWQDAEPWRLANTANPLFYAYHSLRISGILLQPMIPVKSQELLDRLAVPADERRLEDATVKLGDDNDMAHGIDVGPTVERLFEGERLVDRMALRTMFARLKWKKDELKKHGRIVRAAS